MNVMEKNVEFRAIWRFLLDVPEFCYDKGVEKKISWLDSFRIVVLE